MRQMPGETNNKQPECITLVVLKKKNLYSTMQYHSPQRFVYYFSAIYPHGPSIKAYYILFLNSSISCGWKCVKYFLSICCLYNMASDTFKLFYVLAIFQIELYPFIKTFYALLWPIFFFIQEKKLLNKSMINICQKILLTSCMIFERLSSYDRLDFITVYDSKRKLQRKIRKYFFCISFWNLTPFLLVY